MEDGEGGELREGEIGRRHQSIACTDDRDLLRRTQKNRDTNQIPRHFS